MRFQGVGRGLDAREWTVVSWDGVFFYIRIGVPERLYAALSQQSDDRMGRRVPRILHVGLEGHPEKKDFSI
jgi:hypothetical protein